MDVLNLIKNYLALYLIDHGFIRAIYPNMHKVSEGLFRSSQPSPRQLANIKKKHGIKTIINLRGENGLAAYKLEKKFHSAIKNMDASRFSKGVARIKENKEVKQTLKTITGEYKED